MVFILQSPQVCTIFSPKIDVKSSHKCKLIKQEVVVFFFFLLQNKLDRAHSVVCPVLSILC